MNEPQEFPQDDPRGWAVSLDGKISIRTASYRPEAAMINGLVLFAGVDPRGTAKASDDQIRRGWESWVANIAEREKPVRAAIVEVVCILAAVAS